jgi:hypothetical protein
MSDKKGEFANIETSKDVNAPVSKRDEPGLPVKIPVSIVRWMAYTLLFTGPLALWYPHLVGWDGLIGTCFILGHFASQLNAIIKK